MSNCCDRSQIPRRASRVRALAVALVVLLGVFGLISARPNVATATGEDASLISSSPGLKTLNPGETCDVAEVESGTSIMINKSGMYYLTGRSTKTHVQISAQPGAEITVLLKKNLQIAPDNYKTQVPAVDIVAWYDQYQQGKVTLLTESGAEVSLSGYKHASGISAILAPVNQANVTVPPKQNEPMIVLGTQDPANPGKLALDSGSFTGAGINSVGKGFIGITGGKVNPKGTGNYPAIAASNLLVSGGDVYAETMGENTPAIMGINQTANANVVVSGGTVTASASNSAAPAIGSVNGNAEISVSGGFVRARDSIGKVSIGSTSGDATVRITGGTVDSGCASCGSTNGDARVVISGGSFTGYVKGAGKMATAINDSGAVVYRVVVCLEGMNNAGWSIPSWDIEGQSYGTDDISLVAMQQYPSSCAVLWIPENASVVGASDEFGNVYKGEINPTSITSSLDYGALELDSNVLLDINLDSGYDGYARASYQSPELADVEEVVCYVPGLILKGFFDEPSGGTMVIDSEYKLVSSASGWVDDGGKWLRRDAPYTLYAQWEPIRYTITFDANAPSDASTKPAMGTTSPQTLAYGLEAKLNPCGYTLPGYVFTGWNTQTDGGGTSYSDRQSVRDLSEENGKVITLYAQWRPIEYTVVFDANVPASASTKVAGTMEAQVLHFDQSKTLSPNAFSLPGYTFTGWNTKADGGAGGISLTDGQTTSNLTRTDGRVVTLYAQWAPQRYKVTFDANGGSGSGSRKMAFDQSSILPSLADLGVAAPEGAAFVGWCDTTTGKLYDDQAQVINLCDEAEDGTLSGHELQAQWAINPGAVELVITQDGEPVDLADCGTVIALVNLSDPSMTVIGFSKTGIGTYMCNSVSAGTYGIDINAQDDEGYYLYPTGTLTVTVEEGSTAVLHIEYCSVKVEADEGDVAVWVGTQQTTSLIVLKGTEVTIGAGAEWVVGKVFDGWSCWGVKPSEWDSGAMGETMKITINGPLIATAHVRSAVYKVTFNANGGNGNQITMENQDMVYGEPQNLFPNAFTRTGYAFAGWNTEADGGGNLYTDGAMVESLSATDNDTVTLYAQWSPIAYMVAFDANGGDGGGMEPQTFAYDAAQNLSANAFTRTGYTFTGWNTKADGSGNPSYTDGQNVENLSAIDGALITLYAQWEPISYTVAFDANGGDGGSMGAQSFTYDVAQNLSANAFTRTGYAFAGWSTEADGSGASYGDGQSVDNLSAIANTTVTLYAQWAPITYRISFDANVPESASTEVTGYTADQVLTYDKAEVVASCGYTLPGYEFDGWSTEADGGGTRYYPGNTYMFNLAAEDEAVVTLYAQWTPQTYWVTFLPGEGSGDERSQEMTFDESSTLRSLDDLCFTAPQGSTFLGWSTGALGSLYADGANVVNLCTLDENGEAQDMTLTASWADTAGAVVVINENGALSTRFTAGDIKLRQNGSSYKGATSLSDGVFAFGSGLPNGTFDIWIGGKETDKKVDKGGIATVDYCSVKMASDTGGAAWLVDPESVGTTSSLDCVLVGTEIQIKAKASEGYQFKTYAASGTAPEWESEGATQANQTITVKGQVTITAQWNPITYTVTFNANKPDGASDEVSGTMSNREMFYGQVYTLAPCQYTLRGYAFTGWNTKDDGSGVAYVDGGEAENLSATDNDTVTLYAQWRPIEYTVAFDANVPSGASTADDLSGEMKSITCTFDGGETLSANAFALPGYEFIGWNTKADGTGMTLANLSSADGVIDGGGDGQTVTLYAQWRARTYTIAFDANGGEGGSGSMDAQTLTFDAAKALNTCAFTCEGKSFIGWSIKGETGTARLFGDGEHVRNLCILDNDGIPCGLTLQAHWASGIGVIAIVTKDDFPVAGATVSLLDEGGQAGSIFSEGQSSGVYRLEEVNAGTYRISVGDYPISDSFEVKSGVTKTVFIDYSTISVASTDHATALLAGSSENASEVVLTGGEVTLGADVDQGYAFDGYTVIGITPGNFDSSSPAEQKITVQGEVTLTANARPISYEVSFDANGGTGSMPSQEFSYDEPQTLSKNAFTRTGYTFAGWNTMPDGSGDSYADRQEVKNLSNRGGTVFALYAQWESVAPPASYEVFVPVHAHGTASAGPVPAAAGETVTITVYPDKGFEIRSMTPVDAQGRTVELVPQADGTFTFTMPAAEVSVAIVLGCDGGDLCPSRRFPDADPSQWYHDALDWAIVHGVLNGTADKGLMEPESAVTRAQMAQVFWNIAGRPAVSYRGTFDDVEDDDWYAGAVAWAYSVGIFEGYVGSSLFGPEDALTREQAAAVLMRWYALRGNDTSPRDDLSGYPDAGAVSDWATDYVSWAVAAGVMRGAELPNGTLTLDPQGESSRAQTATLIMRLLAVDPLDPFA